MVELFVCLNLTIKESDSFELDDFLYLFDNFFFMIKNKNQFEELVQKTFKIDI
jgi:hypothetical protein